MNMTKFEKMATRGKINQARNSNQAICSGVKCNRLQRGHF
jgi:hypothetical protein